ncbi:probable terpene synthase 6 [Euphorbia lathyris]|uniref:probable terpene synthase 6 n=1 Tax=Euphorbia lathyris TaxID=212925 RepID=UPI003313DF46
MATETDQKDLFRALPDFPPSIWGSTFASLPSQDQQFEAYTEEVEILKVKVKHMLMQSSVNLTTNVEFINLLCRLGVSYHFESEIDEHLNHMFNAFPSLYQGEDYDLYTLGLLFHTFRLHGYKMSSDVFKKFKKNDGEFDNNITSDVKGLLSLYEASFLRVHDEGILDEALDFTKKHLETILIQKSSPNYLLKHIKKSLSRPFHHGVERIETLEYISFYEEEESRNETLLKIAKLDYNRLQLLYRKELAHLSRWWKELKPAEKLPYARDRIVEGYFWTLGSQFEPQYSFARLMGTKYLKMVSVIDDTYDTYGTIDELKPFTYALQRCTIDGSDELPNYMKDLYKKIMDLFGETENHENDGICYRTSYAKKMFIELARGYLVEAEWLNEDGYVPPFDEYLKNGLITSTYGSLSSATMIGMEELGIKDYEWMKSNPKIIEATKLIGRLMNDIKAHEVEYNRRDCPIGMKSYMNEYEVSKDEAIEGIQKICMNAWKDINEAYMKPSVGSRIILKHFLNHARVTDFIYTSHDIYTYSSYLKDVIESLFLHQLPL